jgi:hypothetical protein
MPVSIDSESSLRSGDPSSAIRAEMWADQLPTFSTSSFGGVPLTSPSGAGIQYDPSGQHRSPAHRDNGCAERRRSGEQREHCRWHNSFAPDRTR